MFAQLVCKCEFPHAAFMLKMIPIRWCPLYWAMCALPALTTDSASH